jgi:hypothetical protein
MSKKKLALILVPLVLAYLYAITLAGIWIYGQMHPTDYSWLDEKPVSSTTEPQTKPQDPPLLDQINEYRKEKGLAPLQANSDSTQAAQVRATEVAECGEKCWNHTRPNGESWITAQNMSTISIEDGYYAATENLAECTLDDAHTLKMWKQSPKHNEALLGNYTQAGIYHTFDKSGCRITALELKA